MLKKLTTILTYLLAFLLGSCLSMLAFNGGTAYSKLDELERIIRTHFIAEADETAMEDAAAAAMVGALGDRWSYYTPASEYQSLQERNENAYVGVGMTIQPQEEPAGLLVVQVTDGGGAQEAGILPGDLVTAIDGNPTPGLTAAQGRDLVRGEEGGIVRFEILRDGQMLTLEAVRKIILSPVADWVMLDGDIGLLTIYNFDDRCAQESLAALDALLAEGATRIVFDVRNNPGGYVTELVALLDRLLPEGILFQAEDYAGKKTVERSDANMLDMPMAVLCNGRSFSAAEFFAAALQEYGAAAVVGTPTVGKGYFQYTYQLRDGSAVSLSSGKYFTPRGRSLIGLGIQPDILVEVDERTEAEIYYGTLDPMEDPQIQAAMEALTEQPQ